MVNNMGLVAPEGFLDLAPSSGAYSSCGWLSPRISFSHDFDDDQKLQGRQKAEESSAAAVKPPSSRFSLAGKPAGEEEVDLGGSPGREVVVDFEFRRLDDPVAMLPADELFSDGKLVPLQLASVRPASADSAATSPSPGVFAEEIRSPELQKMRRMVEEAVGSEQCGALFSPKAPRCSSRLRELFGLKKATHNGYGAKTEMSQKSPPSSVSSGVSTVHRSSAARSLRHFLHRSHRSSASIDAYLSLPLLRDSDSDSVSMSARLSLSSSSSSGPDHEELPRLSLDFDKPPHGRNLPRVRLVPKLRPCVDPSSRPNQVLDYRHHQSTGGQMHSGAVAAGAGGSARSPMRRGSGDPTSIPTRGASLDSPRMNSSGKVVFQSLERSSSSPSTFNGGPRVKHRGVERSYSANVVRVAPVLNVPLCSLRGSSKPGSMFGFGQLFASSTQKKDAASAAPPSWVPPRNSNGSSSAAGRSVKTIRSYGEFR